MESQRLLAATLKATMDGEQPAMAELLEPPSAAGPDTPRAEGEEQGVRWLAGALARRKEQLREAGVQMEDLRSRLADKVADSMGDDCAIQ